MSDSWRRYQEPHPGDWVLKLIGGAFGLLWFAGTLVARHYYSGWAAGGIGYGMGAVFLIVIFLITAPIRRWNQRRIDRNAPLDPSIDDDHP